MYVLYLGMARWSERNYFLNKMTLAELINAYVTYPAIQVYALLSLVGVGLSLLWLEQPVSTLAAAAAAILLYPLAWYLLHRFVLHAEFLYKQRATATLWKRIHFDHHQDPNDLRVLFGALYTTLPTIFVVAVPLGWVIAGPAGAAAAVSAGLLTTCFYEFCHCVQHLPFAPKTEWMRRIKKWHLAHHFHNEKGNFGITNFLWDRIFGTFYPIPKDQPRSKTVFNLGYCGQQVERFPWVAELSATPPSPRAARSKVE